MLERLLLFTDFFCPSLNSPSPWRNIEKKNLSVCGGRGVFIYREIAKAFFVGQVILVQNLK